MYESIARRLCCEVVSGFDGLQLNEAWHTTLALLEQTQIYRHRRLLSASTPKRQAVDHRSQNYEKPLGLRHPE